MTKIKLWLRAIRAPFYLGTIMAAFSGSALAFNEGKFNWLYFAASILIIAGANCGTNLINDYFDHLSTNDDINKYATPFSGGSRVYTGEAFKTQTIAYRRAGILCNCWCNRDHICNFLLMWPLFGSDLQE